MENYRDYIIAGHRMRIEGQRLIEAVSGMPGFNIFATGTSGEPVFTAVSSEGCGGISHGDTVLYRSGKEGYTSLFAKRGHGGYYFESSSAAGSSITFETDNTGSRATFSGDYAPDLLRFALWLSYGLAVLPYMTVSLHTSCVSYQGKVVLFLGESGTGKSTHSRLWTQNIEGAELFNDDSPIIRVMDGQIIAYGSPWSGKSMCYRNESFPVAGCVRLCQAPFNRISRLPIPRAYAALHPSCPPDFAYDPVLYDYVSDFLGEMVAMVPVFKMEALPDAEAALLSSRTVFETCRNH